MLSQRCYPEEDLWPLAEFVQFSSTNQKKELGMSKEENGWSKENKWAKLLTLTIQFHITGLAC